MSPHPYLSVECAVSFTSPHRKQSEKGTRNCSHLAFSSLIETSLCYPLSTALVFLLVCFSCFPSSGNSKIFISFLQHPLSSCCLCFSISCATLYPSLPPLTSVYPSHGCFCCLGFSMPHAPLCIYLPYLCMALTLLLLWFCSLPRHVSHTLHLPCFPQEILCRYTTTSMVTWLASLCALVAWRAVRLLNACMPAVRGLITVTSTVWAKG